jgi:hypothetical protein
LYTIFLYSLTGEGLSRKKGGHNSKRETDEAYVTLYVEKIRVYEKQCTYILVQFRRRPLCKSSKLLELSYFATIAFKLIKESFKNTLFVIITIFSITLLHGYFIRL